MTFVYPPYEHLILPTLKVDAAAAATTELAEEVAGYQFWVISGLLWLRGGVGTMKFTSGATDISPALDLDDLKYGLVIPEMRTGALRGLTGQPLSIVTTAGCTVKGWLNLMRVKPPAS